MVKRQSQHSRSTTAAIAATALLSTLCFVVAFSSRRAGDENTGFLIQRSTGSVRQLTGFQESAADDGRTFLQAMPRRTWGAQDVSDEFCSWDEPSRSCNWTDYAQSVSLVAFPSFIVGVVFTLVLGILFCARCCCVGKRCCLLPWSGYSFEPLLINAGLVIFGICILGLIGLGVLGNVWSHEGINNTSDSASNFSATVINVTTDAAALLMEIEPEYAQQANDAIAMANDVQDNLDTVLDILDKVELARFVFFLVIYAGLLLVMLCTFVFVWFFRNFLFCINFWYSWLVFIFIFLILTLCVALGTAVSDVCDVYDDSQDGNNSSVFTEFIGSGWGDCSALEEIINPLFDEYNQTVIEGCEYYANLCNNTATGVTNCTACDTTSDKALLTAYTLVDEVFYCGTSLEQYCPNNDVTQTLEQCSTYCLNPDYRNTSAEVVQYAELMTELDAMIARVKPYAGCQLITRFVEATNEPLCVEYLSGDFLLVVSAIGVCVLWLFYQLLLLLAFERASLRFDSEGDDDLYPLS
ncbi:uncharacterized protein ACA1_072730 [Acanthamoeba castellanii str. Neff]|uniref:Transmembrane protein n=1 Tax=Acanthamoeba castellanii (strain ATCC 30010 / Neff) TaxID=1257118 RepID=L8HER2_ACACF|nr:uncharacterized protein ACA1_072730 [Acanthamoeba castellanii str. Neff]ELR23640.1 hypothetical protein ACA1_072730 [Acanthamoeba castellanii str. Neff]